MKKIIYHIENILDNYYRSENKSIEIKNTQKNKEIVEIELKKTEKKAFVEEEKDGSKEWLIINEYLGEFGELLFINSSFAAKNSN